MPMEDWDTDTDLPFKLPKEDSVLTVGYYSVLQQMLEKADTTNSMLY